MKLLKMLFLVDAFTDVPFKGNPAGVCILGDGCLSDSELQKIAAYYNWSEIAFLRQLGSDRFQIRWFSPKDEAPLCGHATLASAHVIFENHLVSGDTVSFQYNTGTLSASKGDRGITLYFPAKPVFKTIRAPFSTKDIINIKSCVEIVQDDLIYIIVLPSKDDVINAVPNFEAIQNVNCRAIAITAKGDEKFDFYSRYFAPRVGIYEDPVCGSMHCRLAYYWAQVLHKNTFEAYQASKRSGKLHVELHDDKVHLTSKAVTVCKIR